MIPDKFSKAGSRRVSPGTRLKEASRQLRELRVIITDARRLHGDVNNINGFEMGQSKLKEALMKCNEIIRLCDQ